MKTETLVLNFCVGCFTAHDIVIITHFASNLTDCILLAIIIIIIIIIIGTTMFMVLSS